MGVLVADEKTFANGLTLSNFCISIRGKFRGVEKTILSAVGEDHTITYTTVYRVWYNAYFFANQTSYDANSQPIEETFEQLDFTESQVSGNLFIAIYDRIKSNYSSTIDI
jgi:hypothetical protein